MTSARKIRANRVNAQASTGPRTEYGRARATQNTRRYGLSLPIAVLPALSQQAEMLAQEIAKGLNRSRAFATSATRRRSTV